MASKVCELVENLVLPFAEQCGVELVEVEYAKKVNGMNLTIFIDKEEGVSLNDCEKLHRLIDEPLDVLDPTDGKAYILNVSSLGIDRPLKTERDFKR
ncbi:MAG: ribosome maturation factor RimP, partial [Clostridia bacterium]|nr:ribosome maturation factor RimP [Clostridia bacterium]